MYMTFSCCNQLPISQAASFMAVRLFVIFDQLLLKYGTNCGAKLLEIKNSASLQYQDK